MSNNVYSLTEFRNNLRKAFDDANEGRDVFIERYGQRYRLVSLVAQDTVITAPAPKTQTKDVPKIDWGA